MPVTIRERGRYELFETTEEHRILVLKDEKWYALIEGDEGEILVHSDADHEKDHTIQKGRFFLVDFEEDPTFKDMPHLFLQKDGFYQELMLPNGLPTEEDHQKKVVRTDERLQRDELEAYLKDPAPAGAGEDRLEQSRSGERKEMSAREKQRAPRLPLDNYDALTVDEIEEKLDDLGAEEVRKLRRYEARHKDRKTAIAAFDRRLEHA